MKKPREKSTAEQIEEAKARVVEIDRSLAEYDINRLDYSPEQSVEAETGSDLPINPNRRFRDDGRCNRPDHPDRRGRHHGDGYTFERG